MANYIEDEARRPPCPEHGQPMVRGRRVVLETGEPGPWEWLCACTFGAAAVIGDDPDRDRRRAAYQETERRRAARALDRYIEGLVDAPKLWSEAASAAGERFIEAVGDYVLSRMQHNRHYGVPRCPVDGQWCNTCQIGGGNGTGGQCAREHRGVRCTCEWRNGSYLPEAHEPTCAWALSVRFPVKGAELAPDGRKICICGQADGLHVGEVCPVCGSTRRTDEVSGE